MDFSLNQEQQMTQKMVRDFAQKEIAPVIKEYDRKQEPIPFMLKRMGELGILGLPFPVRYGGQGMDYVSWGLACEELEAVDTHLRVVMSVHTGLCGMSSLPMGNGGAEAEISCPSGKRGKDRMWRFYRTRHGIGCCRDDHRRKTGWRPLHLERRKDVDLARLQSGPGAGHR